MSGPRGRDKKGIQQKVDEWIESIHEKAKRGDFSFLEDLRVAVNLYPKRVWTCIRGKEKDGHSLYDIAVDQLQKKCDEKWLLVIERVLLLARRSKKFGAAELTGCVVGGPVPKLPDAGELDAPVSDLIRRFARDKKLESFWRENFGGSAEWVPRSRLLAALLSRAADRKGPSAEVWDPELAGAVLDYYFDKQVELLTRKPDNSRHLGYDEKDCRDFLHKTELEFDDQTVLNKLRCQPAATALKNGKFKLWKDSIRIGIGRVGNSLLRPDGKIGAQVNIWPRKLPEGTDFAGVVFARRNSRIVGVEVFFEIEKKRGKKYRKPVGLYLLASIKSVFLNEPFQPGTLMKLPEGKPIGRKTNDSETLMAPWGTVVSRVAVYSKKDGKGFQPAAVVAHCRSIRAPVSHMVGDNMEGPPSPIALDIQGTWPEDQLKKFVEGKLSEGTVSGDQARAIMLGPREENALGITLQFCAGDQKAHLGMGGGGRGATIRAKFRTDLVSKKIPYAQLFRMRAHTQTGLGPTVYDVQFCRGKMQKNLWKLTMYPADERVNAYADARIDGGVLKEYSFAFGSKLCSAVPSLSGSATVTCTVLSKGLVVEVHSDGKWKRGTVDAWNEAEQSVAVSIGGTALSVLVESELKSELKSERSGTKRVFRTGQPGIRTIAGNGRGPECKYSLYATHNDKKMAENNLEVVRSYVPHIHIAQVQSLMEKFGSVDDILRNMMNKFATCDGGLAPAIELSDDRFGGEKVMIPGRTSTDALYSQYGRYLIRLVRNPYQGWDVPPDRLCPYTDDIFDGAQFCMWYWRPEKGKKDRMELPRLVKNGLWFNADKKKACKTQNFGATARSLKTDPYSRLHPLFSSAWGQHDDDMAKRQPPRDSYRTLGLGSRTQEIEHTKRSAKDAESRRKKCLEKAKQRYAQDMNGVEPATAEACAKAAVKRLEREVRG